MRTDFTVTFSELGGNWCGNLPICQTADVVYLEAKSPITRSVGEQGFLDTICAKLC